ncbi:hypothetical protein [Flavobacterium rhizosphaerae]|uniref:Uncharacterized protein n=1 Tax=Flavobacterium rhizosphaerae TaxID=3163298 RepID=A0ABW8YW76_9FLAO
MKDEEQKDIKFINKPLRLETDFFPKFYTDRDTLYLDITLDDCGEWGGPPEKYMLYKNTHEQYILYYERYRFNCDSINEYYGKKEQLELKKTIVLNKHTQRVLTGFLEDIMRAKISENISYDTASIYYIHANNGTFNVRVTTNQNKIKQDYYNFKENIGLPPNIYVFSVPDIDY